MDTNEHGWFFDSFAALSAIGVSNLKPDGQWRTISELTEKPQKSAKFTESRMKYSGRYGDVREHKMKPVSPTFSFPHFPTRGQDRQEALSYFVGGSRHPRESVSICGPFASSAKVFGSSADRHGRQ